MSYSNPLIRTSMSLDQRTLNALTSLSDRWAVSKAEVVRRAIRLAQQEAEREDTRRSPLEALEWLQTEGGMSVKEGEAFKKAVREEREAKRYWWE